MLLPFLSILCCALLIPSCRESSKRVVVVYSPHGKEMLSAFEQRFEKVHPEIDVRWLDMGSQDAYDRVRTERHNPQADVWWGAPATMFARAEVESLLDAYTPTWDSLVPSDFKSQNGMWYATQLTPEVIMYNSRMLKSSEVPEDWNDLLQPKWRDKIILRYPLASGTMRTIFSALIAREENRTGSVESGFDWLRRLDANTKSYAGDPTQLYLKIAREEAPLSIWNLPDVVIQQTINNYPFGYVVPKSGTPLITDCIALLNGSRHRDDATLFYEFITTRESMLLQAEDFFRIPTRIDIDRAALPEWISSLDLIPMKIDWAYLASHEREWMKRWEGEVKGMGKEQASNHP